MSDFDPDAYLAEMEDEEEKEFDPDAYLADFNPDEYLAETEEIPEADEKAPAEEKEEVGNLKAAGLGVAQGATLGLSDEIWAGLKAGVKGAYDVLGGDPADFEKKYDEALKENRELLEEAKEKNPASYITGEIASLLIPGMGVAKIAKGAGKAAKLAKKAISSPVKSSAVVGALEGGARSEGDLADRAKEAAIGAAIGTGAGLTAKYPRQVFGGLIGGATGGLGGAAAGVATGTASGYLMRGIRKYGLPKLKEIIRGKKTIPKDLVPEGMAPDRFKELLKTALIKEKGSEKALEKTAKELSAYNEAQAKKALAKRKKKRLQESAYQKKKKQKAEGVVKKEAKEAVGKEKNFQSKLKKALEHEKSAEKARFDSLLNTALIKEKANERAIENAKKELKRLRNADEKSSRKHFLEDMKARLKKMEDGVETSASVPETKPKLAEVIKEVKDIKPKELDLDTLGKLKKLEREYEKLLKDAKPGETKALERLQRQIDQLINPKKVNY